LTEFGVPIVPIVPEVPIGSEACGTFETAGTIGTTCLSCATEYFPVAVAMAWYLFPISIENIRYTHVLAFEELALRRFDLSVRGHAVGAHNDFLSLFGEQVIDEQRTGVRQRSIVLEVTLFAKIPFCTRVQRNV
jgi:hypothetical protein